MMLSLSTPLFESHLQCRMMESRVVIEFNPYLSKSLAVVEVSQERAY